MLLLFLFLPRGNARTTLSESRSLFIPAISLYIINNLTRLLSPLLWVLLFLPCTACAPLSCIHTAHFAFDDDERMSGGHQDEGFHRRHLSTNSGSVQSHCFFFFFSLCSSLPRNTKTSGRHNINKHLTRKCRALANAPSRLPHRRTWRRSFATVSRSPVVPLWMP